MQNRRTKTTVLICLLLAASAAIGQQLQLTQQQRFGVEEGLPQSFISGITQDKDGFLWLSTLDGLSRYDGRGFKNFRYQAKNTKGLSANAIYFLLPQPDNSLTLVYDGFQMDEFDMRTEQVQKLQLSEKLRAIQGAIWQMYNLDKLYNGRNWVFLKAGYKGIGWLDCTTGKVYEASKKNGLLKQDTVSALLQVDDGRLFLVSEDGVQVSDSSKKSFSFFAFPTTLEKASLEPAGNGFLPTRPVAILPGNRLAVYDIDRIVVLDLGQKTARSFYIPSPVNSIQAADPAIKTDSRGRLYFKHGGRIYRMSENGEMKLLWENNIAPDLFITAFFIDRSDVLWISVNAQGLVKVDLRALPFQSFTYKTNFVIDILQKAGVPGSQISPQWSVIYTPYYLRQARDPNGILYFSCNYFTENKVYRFDGKGLQTFSLPQNNTAYSALLYSPKQGWQVFDEMAATWYSSQPGNAKLKILPADKASFKDVKLADGWEIGGSLWLSTYSNGLFQVQNNRLKARFEGKMPGGTMPKELTEICPDPTDSNKFWIGSRGGGLIRWDVRKGLEKIYTIDDGLPNNTVYCILPDKGGKIWCSTNKGIFRLDPLTNKILAFEKADGLTGNEFNRAHKFLFPDGRMAFGGLEGFTIFNPADFDKPNKKEPVPVQLTAFQVNNQPQDFNEESSLVKMPLSDLQRIELPYDKNYFRFEFAALQFNQPQKTAYRYRLVGADKDWIENGTNNIAAYVGLPPGHYTFQVNATDASGFWSDTVREVAIRIKPPFWATWWAYSLYALVILAIVRTYFYFRLKRIHTEQSLAFQKKEALRLQEMEEIKDRFFGNITHEFRTPLTLILTPLEKLIRNDSLSQEAQDHVLTARKNAGRLLRLINQFLDFSKLNHGQMKLNLSTGDLPLFLTDIFQSFQALADEKEISLSRKLENMDGFYQFDEEKWEKIIANLLSNALKFTPNGGQVSMYGEDRNDTVKIEISNSGPIIPKDQQVKIFDRFYQANGSGHAGGTGIGLSLVKELTELMNGTVSLKSEGGITSFTVSIPAKKTAANAVSSRVEPQPVSTNGHPQKDRDSLPLVLVAEDNEELRHFLAESLEQNYRVLQAGDGLAAGKIILEELPDLVISDVMMPGQDGFALCKQVKSDIRTSHISLILLTSKASHEAKMQGLTKGADDYISKPFHLAELELRMTNLLQQKENTRRYLQSQLLKPQAGKNSIVQDEFLKRLYEEMDSRLDDTNLGVDYLATVMAMSRSTLNRKLRALLAISTNDLIRQYRLQKGAELLLAGTDISSVAYKVGFSSPSYFTQCFREQYGMTPTDYVHKSTVN